MSLVAIVRPPSPTLERGERTHIGREPIDVELACVQHARYVDALREAGCTLVELAPEPALPDAVFVEDTAVVIGETCVIARPGAPSRRPEVPSVAAALRAYRPLTELPPDATLDGGDVLAIGREIYVGVGGRTNVAGARSLAAILEPNGYLVTPLHVSGCLHLKSAVTALAPDCVLLNPEWVEEGAFARYARVTVDPAEPMAANALRAGDSLFLSSSYPRTLERVRARGFAPRALEASEVHRAEGALTCCSIIFEASA